MSQMKGLPVPCYHCKQQFNVNVIVRNYMLSFNFVCLPYVFFFSEPDINKGVGSEMGISSDLVRKICFILLDPHSIHITRLSGINTAANNFQVKLNSPMTLF